MFDFQSRSQSPHHANSSRNPQLSESNQQPEFPNSATSAERSPGYTPQSAEGSLSEIVALLDQSESIIAEPQDDQAIHLIGLYLQVAELLKSHLTRQFSDIGLNGIRYEVMQFVHQAVPEGCSQADLASEIGQSESSVSTLIERMRQDGLLYRLKSQTDRRKRVLVLTDQGRQLLGQARITYVERMERLLNNLSEDQQHSLLSILNFLEGEISSSASQPAPRQHNPAA